MEQKFSFTVTLSHGAYVLLREESKKREGTNGAVPSRTARQLIEERLEEINDVRPQVVPMTEAIRSKTMTDEDKSKHKSKKPKSTKGDVGEDESTPTI